MLITIGETAKVVANSDKTIKETIENIVAKEQKIIKDYINLKNFRTNAPPEFNNELDKLLEERRLFLAYKMQSKQDQCNALLKLLEYINVLDSKNKEMESQQLLDKIQTLEKEVGMFQNLFN